MQYQVDLEKLVKIALTEEEIQKDMQQANIKTEFLTSKILEKSLDILEAGANEIAELNNLKNKLHSTEDELEKVKPDLPKMLIIILENFKIRYFAAGALVLIVIGYFVFESFIMYLPLIFGTIVLLYLLVNRIDKTYSDRIETAKKEELGINELKKRIELAEQTVEELVVKKGILPELRLLISMQLTQSYDTSLEPLMHKGLAESFDPAYEIRTRSKEKLKRLFNIMPLGSIGIAGPRGAGKTTLLSSFCRPTEKKIKDRQVLSVMTSAPVEYEARDFILHIFTLVCKQVLTIRGMSPKSPWGYINRFPNPLIETFTFFLTLFKKNCYGHSFFYRALSERVKCI